MFVYKKQQLFRYCSKINETSFLKLSKQKNILSPKSRLLLTGFLIFHFLFLVSAKEMFHNHELDGKVHDNCPVLIINNILTSGITTHFEVFTEQSIEIFIPFPTELFFSKPEFAYICLRAPPVV